MSERLKLAEDFMVAAHRSIDQRRKDGKRLYEIHPFQVRDRVAIVTEDEDMLIAALLHDVEEDVETSEKRRDMNKGELSRFSLTPLRDWRFNLLTIGVIFGERVCGLVRELTDIYVKEAYPQWNRKQRKQAEREWHYANLSDDAKVIKLADISINLEDDGGELTDSFGGPDIGFNRMYIKEKILCLPYLKHGADMRNVRLFAVTNASLERQKKKFDVR